MTHPEMTAPPTIDRLGEASERALREEWPRLEAQLEVAVKFARDLERSDRESVRKDDGFRLLQRSLRELDQYARAIAWVITVTET